MKKRSFILFLMLVSIANLVFAADWHEPVMGAEMALEQSVDDDHRAEHPHPPGGSCAHSHSCHAHAHLFFVSIGGHGIVPTAGHRWQAEHLPLPPQHFMAPDVPPPIA
jgi:hypothetical protein